MTRGKKFQEDFQKSVKKQGIMFERIHDHMGGYKSIANFADYYVYNYPNLFYFELKSRKGKYFQIGGKHPDLTDKQFEGLLEKSKEKGVYAGVLVEYSEYAEHYYFPIQNIAMLKGTITSIKIEDVDKWGGIPVNAKLNRTRFTFDIKKLLADIKVG